MNRFKWLAWPAILSVAFSLVPFSSWGQAVSVDYRITVGDKLHLSVPQRPSLNRSATVEPDGAITLPLIGKVRAAGLTMPEFETSLRESIRDYYPSITEVKVTMDEAGRTVYVTGQVTRPGKFSFSTAPNLWEAIREAGGPSTEAAMSQVQIVSDETAGGETRTVNVQMALESGSVDQLPQLRPGDTVIVPSKSDSYTGSAGVNVIGEVENPGIYRLEGRQDLMSVLLGAGGPTRRAKLSEVTVIQPQKNGASVTQVVDLSRYLEGADAASNPLLQPGFTVNVPEQNPITYQIRNNFGIVLGTLTAVLSIAWLVIRIQEEN